MKKPKLFTRIKKHPKWSMFIILLLFAAYYPWFYMGDSIEGVVLDKESGEPVVGAVAVLQFTVSKSKLHGSIEKVIHLAESVTDEEGRYTFDRWGPKFNSFLYRPSNGRIPTIGIYKLGYRKTGIFNADREPKHFKFNFDASKKIIFLEKFKSLEYELELLKEHSSLMAWPVDTGMKCAWQKIPNFMIENDKKYRLYKRNLPRKYQYELPLLIGEWTRWREEGCLDPKLVFKEYLASLD